MLLHYHLCLDTELRAEPIPWYRARRAFFPLKSHFIVTATYVRSNDPTHVQTLVGELPLNVLLMQRVLGRTLGKLLLTVFFFFLHNFSYRDQHWHSYVGISWNCCDSCNVSAYHHKYRRKLSCLCRYQEESRHEVENYSATTPRTPFNHLMPNNFFTIQRILQNLPSISLMSPIDNF